jgi:hypothetical protein
MRPGAHCESTELSSLRHGVPLLRSLGQPRTCVGKTDLDKDLDKFVPCMLTLAREAIVYEVST